MERDSYVLGVLSTSDGQPWTPVQLQKVFFILDEKIPGDIEGPRFAFYPHDYGPYDPAVYETLKVLAKVGKAFIANYSIRTYRLTVQGQREGEQALATLPPSAQAYTRSLSEWLRALSFTDLVTAVYREFPAMAVKAVFCRPDTSGQH